MKLPISENLVHKHIIVKARCCSDCGQLSEWQKRQYYVSCRFSKVIPFENPDTLEVSLFATKEKCQDIVYTTDGTEPTTASPKYENGIQIAVYDKNGKIVQIKSRLVCRETGQMGEVSEKTYKVPNAQVIGFGNKVIGFGNKVIGKIGG